MAGESCSGAAEGGGMCGGEVGRRAGGDHGDTARGAETCPGPNRSPGGGVEERPGVAGEAAPLSGAWVRSARQQAREEESPQRGAQGLSRDAGARSLRAASRPRPAAMLALVALAGLWLEVAAGEDDTYLLTRAGRSPGIPACAGGVASGNCYRVDSAMAPDACVKRDADTGACLVTTQAVAYGSSLPSTLPLPSQVDLARTHLGVPRVCAPGDLECVPDGVHVSEDIDWGAVEGAEYVVGEVQTYDGVDDVFVDASKGSDLAWRGTREAPFRSLRSAVRRWLAPGACAPWCGDAAFSSSATIRVVPGVYAGDDNRGIEVFLSEGVTLTIQNQASERSDRGTSYTRKSGCHVTPEAGPFFLKVSGTGGELRLLGLAIHNASYPAIVVPKGGGVTLHSDLFFPHGRAGQVAHEGGSNSANWDTSLDERAQGRTLDCDSPDGCVDTGAAFGYDARFSGPLAGNSALCPDCWVPVRFAGEEGEGGRSGAGSRADPGGYGLNVLVEWAGRDCGRGGDLEAQDLNPDEGARGSGFAASFSVLDGAVSRVTLTSPGSGYTSASHVAIRVKVGGDSCAGVLFSPFLVYDSFFH